MTERRQPDADRAPQDDRERALAAAHGADWIAPGVLRLALPTPTLPPATTTNHVLVGRGEGVLVDPATPDLGAQRRLRALIEALERGAGWRLRGLLLSHHHNDHVGAAGALRDALGLPIWAHAATAPLLPGGLTIDRAVADGEALAGEGADRFFALHTPGHAPGHLVLHRRAGGDAGGMIVADMVAAEGTILIDPSEGDMGQYLASLRAMAALGPTWLLPAHGPTLRPALATLERYVAHRLAREAKVLAALSGAWRAASDLLPDAYGDTPRAIWPLAARSLRAHLVHLERQALAEQRGGRWRRR